MHVGGRTRVAGSLLERQWPGTYFETAFRGSGMVVRIGRGEVHLHITVDGGRPLSLVRPKAGDYRIEGLTPGRHQVRVEVVSESQAGPTAFGGFYPLPGTRPLPPPRRTRQIEFIGDSYTVGYGNTSTKGECTTDEVWATTDSGQGIAARTAARFGADYQINAISGRGVVRNYNGGAGDTLPEAYPFALFADKSVPDQRAGWVPQTVVIGLGTNDFSTALHAGEKWQSREALHADFEKSFVRFVDGLRGRYPRALIVLWATDVADGEVAAEGRRVVELMAAGGDRRIRFVAARNLAMSGCHSHPTVADDAIIADALFAGINAHR